MRRYLLSTTVLPPYLLDLRPAPTAILHKNTVTWLFKR